MSKRTRRIIFYIFLFFFIVLAIVAILYALGYTLDWQNKSLVMQGAFYFKSFPKGADIVINNKDYGKTSRFIKRILPGEYSIDLSMPGYSNWHKTLDAKPGLVVEIKHILLIPQDLALKQVTDYNVKKFYPSQHGKLAIYLTNKAVKKTAPLLTYSRPALRLINFSAKTDVQIYPSLADDKNISFLFPDLNALSSISWSLNNKKVILTFLDNNYYILDLDQENKIINFRNNLYPLLTKQADNPSYIISNLSFHPEDSNKIYFLTDNTIYLMNTSEKKLTKIISDVLTYTIDKDKILYLSQSGGTLFQTNFEVSSFEEIFEFPVFKTKEKINIINSLLATIGNKLYFFEPETKIFRKIGDQIEQISFSKNKEKLFWKTPDEIKVIWFEQDLEQPVRERHEMELILKSLDNIKQAAWFHKTNKHIIFTTEGQVKIVELDGRGTRNIINMGFFKEPQLFFNEFNDYLYLLSQEILYKTNMNIK